MRSVAQSVQDKVIESAKKVSRLFGYGTEISEIGGITKSESQDGSGAMVCRDRDYFQAEKIERAVDCVHFHARQRSERLPAALNYRGEYHRAQERGLRGRGCRERHPACPTFRAWPESGNREWYR